MKRSERTLSKREVMKRLLAAIDKAGNQHRFAQQIGVSPSVISYILYGKREFPDRVLNALGVERVTMLSVTYREKTDAE